MSGGKRIFRFFSADSTSQEAAGTQPSSPSPEHPQHGESQQPQPSASASVPGPDAPESVVGPSTERPSNQVGSDVLRQLVEFADAGIDDLGSFLGLVGLSHKDCIINHRLLCLYLNRILLTQHPIVYSLWSRFFGVLIWNE